MSEKNKQNVRYLLAMVEDLAADPLTCIDADALLPEFHQAVQLETHDQPHWQPLLRHLGTCPACAQQLVSLAELERFALGEAGLEPDRYPEPDPAAFHRRQAVPNSGETTGTKFWHVDRWGRIIVDLSEQVLRGRYDALVPEGKRPLAGLAEGRATFRWDEELDDRNLSVEIAPSLSSPGDYDLSIQIEMMESVSPSSVAGTKITVYQGDNHLATAVATTEGVMITRIPSDALGQLLIEIDPVQGLL